MFSRTDRLARREIWSPPNGLINWQFWSREWRDGQISLNVFFRNSSESDAQNVFSSEYIDSPERLWNLERVPFRRTKERGARFCEHKKFYYYKSDLAVCVLTVWVSVHPAGSPTTISSWKLFFVSGLLYNNHHYEIIITTITSINSMR